MRLSLVMGLKMLFLEWVIMTQGVFGFKKWNGK